MSKVGLLDKLKGLIRRGGESQTEKGVKYVLKYKAPNGGWRKFKEFDHFVSPDDIIEELPPGQYRLDVHREGQRGFEVVWGPIVAFDSDEQLEEMGIPTAQNKRSSVGPGGSLDVIDQFVEQLEKQIEVMQKLGDLGLKLAVLSGKPIQVIEPGKSQEEVILEGLMKMRERYEQLDKIFGTSKLRGQEAELPIEGKVPAWAVYVPKMVDQMIDTMESRLRRLGLLEDVYSSRPSNGSGRSHVSGGSSISDFPDLKSYKQRVYDSYSSGRVYRYENGMVGDGISGGTDYGGVGSIEDPEDEIDFEEPDTKANVVKKDAIVKDSGIEIDEVDLVEPKSKKVEELINGGIEVNIDEAELEEGEDDEVSFNDKDFEE